MPPLVTVKTATRGVRAHGTHTYLQELFITKGASAALCATHIFCNSHNEVIQL